MTRNISNVSSTIDLAPPCLATSSSGGEGRAPKDRVDERMNQVLNTAERLMEVINYQRRESAERTLQPVKGGSPDQTL